METPQSDVASHEPDISSTAGNGDGTPSTGAASFGSSDASPDGESAGAPEGGTLSSATDSTATDRLQPDEKQAIPAFKDKGASTPPASDDKTAKGIEPADDPARRIDEMTNSEAKAFSASRDNVLDGVRPAPKGNIVNPSTGKRTPEAEAAYREVFAAGWNDHKAGTDNRTKYSGDTEKKSAYVAGWDGEAREASIPHEGGDMHPGVFEKARLSGAASA